MLNRYKCLKCQHEWMPRKPNPHTCPKCKTTKWRNTESVKEAIIQPITQKSDVLDNRIAITIYVKPDIATKMQIWKQTHPNEHWDVLQNAALCGIKVSRSYCKAIIEHQTP